MANPSNNRFEQHRFGPCPPRHSGPDISRVKNLFATRPALTRNTRGVSCLVPDSAWNRSHVVPPRPTMCGLEWVNHGGICAAQPSDQRDQAHRSRSVVSLGEGACLQRWKGWWTCTVAPSAGGSSTTRTSTSRSWNRSSPAPGFSGATNPKSGNLATISSHTWERNRSSSAATVTAVSTSS